MIRYCLAAGLVLCLGTARVPVVAADKTDKESLLGIWKLTRIDKDGRVRQVTDKSEDYFDLIITDKELQVRFFKACEKGTYGLGMDKDQRTITITPTTGDDKGKKILGIYRLKGDELTIAVAEPGASARPTQFKSEKGKVTVYYTQRVKSKP